MDRSRSRLECFVVAPQTHTVHPAAGVLGLVILTITGLPLIVFRAGVVHDGSGQWLRLRRREQPVA